MKKRIYVALIAVLVVAGAMYGTRARNSQSQLNAPASIPALEAQSATLSNQRGDSGRLSAKELQTSQEPIQNLSTSYVLTELTNASVTLPVTGQDALVGIYSKDSAMDVELRSPNGNVKTLKPVAPDADFETTQARSSVSPEGKMVVTPLQTMAEPGNYTLVLKRGASSVDVVVNDRNDLVLKSWLSDNGVDTNAPVELRAQVLRGNSPEAANISARFFSEDGNLVKTVKLDLGNDGVYTHSFKAERLGHFAKVLVDAEGMTSAGQAFRRTGYLALISGTAGAQVVSILNEKLTPENLELEVSVKIKTEGRFHLRADLVTKGGDPVAWAQAAERFAPGTHTLTLRFDRRTVTSGQSLVVRNLELTNVTTMPAVKCANKLGNYSVQSAF